MAHGITLTASHTLVFFGVIAGNEIYRQAIRRIRRIGQTHKQTVINLISTKFEQKCFDKLNADEFTSQAVMDMYKGKLTDFI
jgi:SNF2 family DNA or RNA helicase